MKKMTKNAKNDKKWKKTQKMTKIVKNDKKMTKNDKK